MKFVIIPNTVIAIRTSSINHFRLEGGDTTWSIFISYYDTDEDGYPVEEHYELPEGTPNTLAKAIFELFFDNCNS